MLCHATRCHTMPCDAVRSSHPRERQLRLLLAQDLQEAGASPQLQAGSRRVQDQCQAEEGCLVCLGWHGTAVPLLLPPLTSGCPQTHPTGGGDCPPWGGEQVCTASGPAPLPSGRWKTSWIRFLYRPKPLLVCWERGIDVFIAALWYKSASPKPRSLQTQTDLQHREPRAPPRSRPLEQAAFPCTTVRPQTETYVTGRRPGKIINFAESFFNGKERRKTPSDILISPWILLVPWCLSVTRPRRS